MSNEVKVGILAVAAIALSIWGYKFIRGNNMLLKSNTYKVYYPKVDRMQVGTQAFINGVEVGSVAGVGLLDDVDRTVEVILDLDPGIRIPKNTTAVIVSTGFMGGKAIMLEYPRPCSGDDCAQSGDVLEGEIRGLLGSMVGEDNVEEYVGILKEGLQEVIDSLNTALIKDPDSPLAKSMKDLESTLANLNSATGQLDGILRSSSGSINGTLANLNDITGNLSRNNEKINSILSNADSLSAQLLAADLEKTLEEANSAIASLKATLQSADVALGGVSDVVGKINQGEGSLGKLITDEKLYRNINELSRRADSLITDFQERPYRYVPFKGRNKVRKYDRRDEALDGQ